MCVDICRILGIKYPIFQGAMTFVSDQHLVSAVSNAGGLGIFAPGDDAARGGADWLREKIRELRGMTDKPFGVNLAMRSPLVADFVQAICEEKVPVITTGGGNPAPYLPRLKEAGVVVAPVVPDAKTALKMEAAGADMVIASGTEGGGFVGGVTTMVTLPQVTAAVKIPVIAAGGIADGRGMAAAFAMGASGVQMGTRFMLSKECAIPGAVKQAMLSATSRDVVAVDSRLRSAPQLRALRTKAAQGLLDYEKSNDAQEEVYRQRFEAARAERLLREGNVDEALLPVGASAGMISELMSVEEILSAMMDSYRAAVASMPRL